MIKAGGLAPGLSGMVAEKENWLSGFSDYWGDTPIRTPGRVSVARSEIVIRFLGCPNPENHRVSDLPAPLVGKSRFFTGVQIPEFRIPGV